MAASVDTCREQEALQRARAISEPLENCRKIALNAANAWAAEAVLAERRAAKTPPLDKADAAIAAEFALEAAEGAGDATAPALLEAGDMGAMHWAHVPVAQQGRSSDS